MGLTRESEALWTDAKEAYGLSAANLENTRCERDVVDAQRQFASAKAYMHECNADVWRLKADAYYRRMRAAHGEVSSLRTAAQLVQSDLVDAAGSDHEDEIEDPDELDTSSFASERLGDDDS